MESANTCEPSHVQYKSVRETEWLKELFVLKLLGFSMKFYMLIQCIGQRIYFIYSKLLLYWSSIDFPVTLKSNVLFENICTTFVRNKTKL